MTLKDILTITEDRMNKNEYCTEVIFPYGKSGMIQKVIEIEVSMMKKVLKLNALKVGPHIKKE